MQSSKTIRVAVIGVGSFGRNHARVYHQLQQESQKAASAPTASLPPAPAPRIELAAIVDANPERATEVAREFGAQPFTSIEQMLRATTIDAASVAVPTIAHLEAASALMNAGVDVLIEKPIAASREQADELISIAKRTGCIAQVGQLERFNPAVRATMPFITNPMFFEVHRLSIFTPRSLDVDVVLDLMIHDLDVVLSLVNSPVSEIRAVGLPVLTNKVDIANVRVQFESGCVANFTASRVSTERVRKLRFFQPHQYVSLDYSRRDVFMLTVKPIGAAASASSEFTMPDIVPSKPEVVAEEPLLAELRSFLHAVDTRTAPLVPLEDGRRALALALDVLSAIEEHSRRANLDSIIHAKA
ncbi:MAG TPA: Gfo/Idh/MocA family oxidoreductase [Clostridia bacterium]|nr:Gfo/Idh/MocA family oxidoreductase [Clostridia bacterium]